METSGLKTLTTPLYFCSRASSILRPSFLPHVKKKFQEQFQLSLTHSSRFSLLCSLSEKRNGNSLSNGFGEAAVSKAPQDKLLQVVLVSPQIPGNTGSIARSCAASGVGLHLIEPLGFDVDDTKLKRAGLDYWPKLIKKSSNFHTGRVPSLRYVVVKVHSSWADFRDYFSKQSGDKRLLAFTKRGTNIHSDYAYRRGDWLVFGSETNGLPPEALLDCKSESLGGGTIRIPMIETYVRCLNLSVSVGIALYEASRQLNYEQFECPPEPCNSIQPSLFPEDVFA